jgi:meso-butanediol dehydrogenase/(S,S)-butanediol dehydrogenase/diacetyl reductase
VKRLEGRKALVTGGAGGIGRAVALRLAQEGAHVAVGDVDVAGAQETARQCGGAAFRADVASEEDVRALVTETIRTLAGLDIVVNNAGVAAISSVEHLTDPDMRRILAVNLEGVIRVTRAAVPHLKASRFGRVINLGSVEALRGSALMAAYAASKGGVLAVTRANAVELGRHGITVNAICPGPIMTSMLQPLIAVDAMKTRIIEHTVLKRLGRPEEIAAAAAFLASDDAAYITGHELVVDGGLTVHT